MKRFLRILTSVLALVILATACLGLVGCKEEVTKVKLTLAVYNAEDGEWYETKDTVITVDLYKNYAPKTVKNIVKYVKDGYYDNTVFYTASGESGKIFVGDIKIDEEGNLYKNDEMDFVQGEFEAGGVVGSPLKVKKGAVALWRTWADGSSYKASEYTHTGSSTWFLPTSDNTSYDGYFCVFATIDMSVARHANTFNDIKTALDGAGEENQYQIYYTGEYQDNVKGNGLTFNIVKLSEYVKEDIVDLFESEDGQLVCYNPKTISIADAGASGFCGAKIVSAKIV